MAALTQTSAPSLDRPGNRGGDQAGTGVRRAAAALCVGLALVFGSTPGTSAADGRAQVAVIDPSLSEADRADLKRIERYLNAITTMTARFVQITDDGRYSEGKLFLSRPGRLRFEYEPPVPVLMVANRGTLIYYDAQLNQVSYVDIDSTPLWFITRPEVNLSDPGVTVSGFFREAGVIRVILQQTDDLDAGQVILSFSEAPLELRKWTVVDGQGVSVNVALFNAETGMALDAALFEFKDPSKSGRN